MQIISKTGRLIELPTDEENEAINSGIALDPDTYELDDGFFERATRGRPVIEHPKKAVNIRLDQDVLDYFRNTGKGWQTRVNALLRETMERQVG